MNIDPPANVLPLLVAWARHDHKNSSTPRHAYPDYPLAEPLQARLVESDGIFTVRMQFLQLAGHRILPLIFCAIARAVTFFLLNS